MVAPLVVYGIGAGIAAVGSIIGGNSAAKATQKGAEAAAEATIRATELQIAEVRRQFDYQAQVLYPLLQNQYNAAGAYGDLLGINRDNTPGTEGFTAAPPGTTAPVTSTSTPASITPGGPGAVPPGEFFSAGQEAAPGQPISPRTANLIGEIGGGYQPGIEATGDGRYQPQAQGRQDINQLLRGVSIPEIQENLDQLNVATNTTPIPTPPPPGSFQANRNERGAFIDPNVDPLSLEESQRLEGQVRNTLLSTPGGAGEADRMRFAQDRNIYGTEFEESPGYAFQREEMERQLERRQSAGGNYGGRAIMESQRRAQGLAAGDYYNWAAGAERDRALEERVYDEEFQRETGDVARLDASVAESDRLRAVDLQRTDQGYQNYLANVARQAGFSDVASQTVQASQTAGGAVAGAYGSSGRNLSNIALNEGTNIANIRQGTATNVTNAATQGLQNYMLFDYLNNNPVAA